MIKKNHTFVSPTKTMQKQMENGHIVYLLEGLWWASYTEYKPLTILDAADLERAV